MTGDAIATTGAGAGLNQLRKLDTPHSPVPPPTVGTDPGTASRSIEFATLLDRAAAVDRRHDTGMADRRRPGTPEVIGRQPGVPGPTATTPTPTPQIDRPPVDRVATGRSRQPDSDRRTTNPDRTTRADRGDRDRTDPVDRDAAGGVEGSDTGADDDPASEPTTPDGREAQLATVATVVTTPTTAPADAAMSDADPSVADAIDGNADPGLGHSAVQAGASGMVQAGASGTVQAGANGDLGVGSGAAAGTATTAEEAPATGPAESQGAETSSATALEPAPAGADVGGADVGGADLAISAADPDPAVDPAPADPTAGASNGSGHEGGAHDGAGQGYSTDPEPTSTPAPGPSTIVTGAAAAAAFGATTPGAGDATKPQTGGDGAQSALSGPATSNVDLGLAPTTTQTTIGGPASADSGAGTADPVWRQVQRALNTVRLNAAGEHELTIRLRPEELGSVLVTVTTGEAGTTVSLMADSRAAASQLLAQRHLLLDQLQDGGLGGATVDVGLGDTSGRSDSGPGTGRDNDTRSALATAPNPGPRAGHQPDSPEVARPRSGTNARVDLAL